MKSKSKWIDVIKELPVPSKDIVKEGYRWMEVIVYADDGVLSYTGEALFFWKEKRFEINFHLDNFDLSDDVKAWMPMIPKPKFKGLDKC